MKTCNTSSQSALNNFSDLQAWDVSLKAVFVTFKCQFYSNLESDSRGSIPGTTSLLHQCFLSESFCSQAKRFPDFWLLVGKYSLHSQKTRHHKSLWLSSLVIMWSMGLEKCARMSAVTGHHSPAGDACCACAQCRPWRRGHHSLWLQAAWGAPSGIWACLACTNTQATLIPDCHTVQRTLREGCHSLNWLYRFFISQDWLFASEHSSLFCCQFMPALLADLLSCWHKLLQHTPTFSPQGADLLN